MARKIQLAAVVAFALLGLASLAFAQDSESQSSSQPGKAKTFFSDLRSNLFGYPAKEESARKPVPPQTKKVQTPAVAAAKSAQSSASLAVPAERSGGIVAAPGASSLVARQAAALPDAVAPGDEASLDDIALESRPVASGSSSANVRPLHERMSSFHKSSFGSESESASAPGQVPAEEPAPTVVRPESPAVVGGVRSSSPVVLPPRDPSLMTRTATQRTKQPSPAVAAPRPAPIRRDTAVAVPAVVASAQPVADRKPAKDDGMLIARKSPILSVETLGPRRITVGKESSYQVTVSNSGEIAAEEVVVYVNLPTWAEVIGTESLIGVAQLGVPGDESKPLQWKVGQLSGGAKERMTLRIVPRESKPFDLNVRWDYKPVASRAMIEVQEPKLSMHLEGPREVNYGKREVYTLKLANIGTGDAENVAIALMPIGAGDNQPATHRIGLVTAGEEKAIEIELTARQSGDLVVQVEARADGDIHIELAEKVLVRRAAVAVELVGPSVQFVNSVTQYRVRVTNPGNAVARNVKLSAVLPAGAKYVSGIDSARVEANGSKVQWMVDTIHAQGEQLFVLKCNLGAAGPGRLEVVAAADDDINATASTVTRVEAIADIAMEVKDPSGPVAVGEEAVYELRVRNRGTKSAEGVEIVAFFSNGVEPVNVEGGKYRLQAGQVAFNPIPTIAPGAEVVFKIHAKAETAGAHVFRAEAHCRPLGTRLVREETTHFYIDNPVGPSATQTVERDGGTLPAIGASRQPLESASGANSPKFVPLKR